MRARPKNVLLLLIFLVAVPLFWMSFVIKQDDSSDILVEQKLLEMKERLQFAENLNKIREHDLKVLQSQFKFMAVLNTVRMFLMVQGLRAAGSSLPLPDLVPSTNDSHRSTNESVLRDMQRALQNFSRNDNHNRLYIPSIFSYLPHLVGDDGSVKPAYKVSRNRVGVSMVFGVPTVKRLKESYLIPTLEHLVSGLDESEQEDALIVVFIAEPYDQDYVKTVGKEIQNKLPDSVKSGLIEIVSPPATFYPDMDKLRLTLGDPPERVKWRTKQNLDFAFLMLYAKNRGLYYTQLEDDVIAKPGYLSTMKSFAFNQKNDNWMVLEFSQLGFIGKMFKSQDLPLFAEFFVMFHNDKPVDWLLDNLMYVKFCSPEKSPTHCRKVIADIRRRYKPSLFQHVGIHSSLKGKTQKLKDKDFGKQDTNLIRSHHNPPAEVRTSLTVYQKYSLDKAYMGQTIFWGLTPEAEDTVEFHLRPPVLLYGYLFRSGNREHPGDRFANTSVEILPASHINDNGAILENVPGEKIYPEGDKGFLILGHFNEKGLATGPIDPRVGEVAVIRLHALTKSDSWVILSEIMLQTTKRS